MKKNKRADVPFIAVMLVLTAFLGVVLVLISYKPLGTAGRFFSSKTLEAEDKGCLIKSQDVLQEVKFDDRDKDKRDDKCDICLSCSGGNSHNDVDSDGDKEPDYCDEAPDDRTIVACKPGMRVTKDDRCVDTSCPYQ